MCDSLDRALAATNISSVTSIPDVNAEEDSSVSSGQSSTNGNEFGT